MKSLFSTLYSWADERLGLEEFVQFAKHKTVPVHSQAFWYYWGGLSLFFFVIQCATGVLLLLYYRPGPDAYDSVRQITYDTNFGWLVRSVHSWAANLMIAAICTASVQTAVLNPDSKSPYLPSSSAVRSSPTNSASRSLQILQKYVYASCVWYRDA